MNSDLESAKSVCVMYFSIVQSLYLHSFTNATFHLKRQITALVFVILSKYPTLYNITL